MTEERNYTPYDGKENDWHTFARQQAEFYRNAEQYTVVSESLAESGQDELRVVGKIGNMVG